MRTLHLNGMTPPALAIAIALGEKGLDFTMADHDWRATADALGEFADRLELTNTLEGEFPILVDDGTAVSDSYFVLEYLDDAYPDPPLRPADAYGQWQVQAFARFLGERILPAVSTLGVGQRFTGEAGHVAALASAPVLTPERRNAWTAASATGGDAELRSESLRQLRLFAGRLDEALSEAGGPWLFGARLTIADIGAFALVHHFLAGNLDGGAVAFSAAVRDWHARMADRGAVRQALGLREPAFLPGPEHSRWG